MKVVDKDRWIEHDGGQCPVPKGTLVDVEFRDGEILFDAVAQECKQGRNRDAAYAFWYDSGCGADIVAYRVVSKNPDVFVEVPEVVAPPNIKFIDCYSDGVLYKTNVDTSVGTAVEAVAEANVEAQADTNPKKQYGVQSIPLHYWSDLASAYGALGLYNGALKYGTANFANTPVEAGIYIDAIKRHLAAWCAGEEFDPADGVPNLGGVLANVAILLEARAAGTLIDDRPKLRGYLIERSELKPKVIALNELHADKNPKHYFIESDV